MNATVRWAGGILAGGLLLAAAYLWAVRGPAILLDISGFFCL